jgi:hypothetical protein
MVKISIKEAAAISNTIIIFIYNIDIDIYN